MPIAIAASTIVQQAFRFMEMRGAASFGDDSEQAIAAAEQYDIALAMVLAAYDWSFASVVSLAAEVDPTSIIADPRLPFAFVLPDDCVMLREVIEPFCQYRADKGLLRTDCAGPLTARYTAAITNEKQIPATVQVAVALQLAVLLAPQYVEVQSKIDRIEARLSEAIKVAARTDGRTASPVSYSFAGAAGDWATEATY